MEHTVRYEVSQPNNVEVVQAKPKPAEVILLMTIRRLLISAAKAIELYLDAKGDWR